MIMVAFGHIAYIYFFLYFYFFLGFRITFKGILNSRFSYTLEL